MDKKLVYIFSDNFDYQNIVFEDLSGITEWILNDDLENKSEEELEEYQYTISAKFMTQEEIDELEERD